MNKVSCQTYCKNNTNIKIENINAKYGFAFDPAVSLIIFDTKVYNLAQLKAASYLVLMNFLAPKLKIIKIAIELITINRLALVNDKSIEPNLISGPIL